MDWHQQFDGYCERTDLTLWSEPLNAITNIAFLIAAFVIWRRIRGQGMVWANVLVWIMVAIGVGSGLFHTFATAWASLADVAPIGIYILVYLYAVNSDVLDMPWWLAAIGVALFAPYAALLTPVFNGLPFFHISNFYWVVPLLILAYTPFVARKRRETALGMSLGAAILAVSISIRSLDEILCAINPFGTHFLWHILNAVMLGWMIEVYRRHMLGKTRVDS